MQIEFLFSMKRASNVQSDQMVAEQLDTLPANLTDKLTAHIESCYKLKASRNKYTALIDR